MTFEARVASYQASLARATRRGWDGSSRTRHDTATVATRNVPLPPPPGAFPSPQSRPTTRVSNVRVRRCFSFLDLCGFTAYTETGGDSQAVSVLALLRATLRAECERSGVRVTKWLGDGAMLSGIERAGVLEATASVAARMRDESPLALRAGIAEGPVIMFEGDDYIGATVNAASRLCDVALPGQILVSTEDASPHELPRWMQLRPLGPLAVAGLSRPVEVAEIVVGRSVRP